MFELEVTVRNLARLERIIRTLRNQPKLVKLVTDEIYQRYKPRIEALLAAEPPPSSGQIQWTSPAQRVTVIALLRKAARAAGRPDIRYIRQHRISRGYLVEIVPTERQGQLGIQISNATPYLVYVKWKWQQRFHARTGWQRDDIALRSVQEDMAEAFADRATVAFREADL